MKTLGSHEKNESEGDVQIEEDKIKSEHCSFLSHPPTIIQNVKHQKDKFMQLFAPY